MPGSGVQGSSQGTSRGGSINGASSTSNGLDDPSAGANPSNTGNANAGHWDANTRGVVGLHNLSLNSAGGDAQGSVLKSTGKTVKLDGGTRLLLVTGAVAPH